MEPAIVNAGTKALDGGPGTSGGVGIATPAYRGLSKFEFGTFGEPESLHGRVAYRHWGALQKGGIAVVSVYLVTGEGPRSPANVAILSSLASELRLLGRPYIVGVTSR